MEIKQWELNELRSRFERHLRFCKTYFPCDPFGGTWVDADHLPAWVLPICQLAEEKLHPADRELKYKCFERRGTAFNNCCVDRLWLASFLNDCQRQEPEAHEAE